LEIASKQQSITLYFCENMLGYIKIMKVEWKVYLSSLCIFLLEWHVCHVST
jgi:hypothetical protein